ncbi:glucan synthase 1-like protein [Deinococcus sp. SDU3-2]|uniref:Glucan synthase 1-like protein n=1 Tax=Deinococcus terrestris TaxID=2651870 RepID=A0A7X1TR75_9DEIO|nr:SMI1/KNR4 family protein [Deinococcus terrestris]MPY66460.1 glucan synthase 1-like protein [Deinococcus terrestris]
MSEIEAVWRRIEAWYELHGTSHLLNSGATDQAIAEAEKQLGVSFPAELQESLRRHDGSNVMGWASGELLSLERIASERRIWMELLQDGTFDDNAKHNADSEAVQPGWWNAAWIPLDADGGGNGAVIDMAPGPEGTAGQIIDMDHEVGPNGPQYQSLTEYLEAVADGLEAERFVVYDGAVVSIDEMEEGS